MLTCTHMNWATLVFFSAFAKSTDKETFCIFYMSVCGWICNGHDLKTAFSLFPISTKLPEYRLARVNICEWKSIHFNGYIHNQFRMGSFLIAETDSWEIFMALSTAIKNKVRIFMYMPKLFQWKNRENGVHSE